MKISNMFLMLKQGIKGVFKFKIQFIIIALLSFLSTFILSVSLSTESRLKSSYDEIVSPIDEFSFSGTTRFNSTVDATADPLLLPMLLSNQGTTTLSIRDSSGKLLSEKGGYNWVFNTFDGKHESFLTKGTADFISAVEAGNDIKPTDQFSSVISNPSGGLASDKTGSARLFDYYLSNLFWELDQISDEKNNGLSIGEKMNGSETIYSPIGLFTYNNPNWYKDLVTLTYEDENKTKAPKISNINYNSVWGKENGSIFRTMLFGVSYLVDLQSQMVKEFNTNSNFFLDNSFASGGVCPPTKYQITNNAQAIAFLFGVDVNQGKTVNTSLPNGNQWIVNNKNKPYSINASLTAGAKEGNDYIFATPENKGDVNVENAIWNSGLRGISNPLVNNQISIDDSEKISFSNITNWDWYSKIDLSTDVYLNNKRMFYEIDFRSNVPADFSFNYNDFITLANGNSSDAWTSMPGNRMFNTYLDYNKIVSSALNLRYGFRREETNFDALNKLNFRTIVVDNNNDDKNVAENYDEDYNFKIIEGSRPAFNKGEIAVNQQFADKNHIKVGDTIKSVNASLTVKAIAVDAFSYMPGQDLNMPIPNPKTTAFVWAGKRDLYSVTSGNWTGGQISGASVIDTLCYFLWDEMNNKSSLDAREKAWYALFSNSIDNLSANTRAAKEFVDNGTVSENTKSSNLDLTPFDKSIFKYSWTILPMVLKIYDSIVYTAAGVIALIAIIALIASVKKTVEFNSKQIGILKALGEKPEAISISYTAQPLLVGILIVPVSWLIGIVCQIPFVALFKGWFTVFVGSIAFDWVPFVIAFAVLGVFSLLVSYFSAFVLTKKPMLEILQSSVKWGRLPLLDFFKKKALNRWPFSVRFSTTLTSSGSKQISLMTVVMLVASFLVGISIALPAILSKVNSSYYAAVKYSNKYTEVPLIGNQPLSKAAISYWDGQKYDDSQFTQNKYLKDGYYKDPAIYYSTINNSSIFSQYIYDVADQSVHDSYSYMLKNRSSLIDMITYFVGNNLYNNQGVGISIGMIDALYGTLVHSLEDPIKNDANNVQDINASSSDTKFTDKDRESYLVELGNSLTTQLPAILNQVFGQITGQGSVAVTGDTWKDKVFSIILTQLPAFVKNYVQQSASREEQFGVTFQNEIYIPGQETLATVVNNPEQQAKNKSQNVTLTGLDKNQNSVVINDDEKDKIYISDSIKNSIYDHLNVPTVKSKANNNPSLLNNSNLKYDESTNTLTIPVLANNQSESAYDFSAGHVLNNWNNNLGLMKVSFGNNDPVVLPSDAWVYDDNDYAQWFEKKNNTSDTPYAQSGKYSSEAPNAFWNWTADKNGHYYIDASKIPEGKLTYANEFSNNELADRALMFKEFMYDKSGRPVGTYLRPMYQYKNMKLMLPLAWINKDNALWNDSKFAHTQNNKETTNWYSEVSTADVPQSVLDSYQRLTINNESLKKKWNDALDNKWLVINPYDLAYYNDKDSSSPLTNLTDGTPYWMKYILGSGSIFSIDSNSSLKEYLLSMGANPNINIQLKNVGNINSYNDKLVVADQDIVNWLSGFKNTREYQYNYQVFDKSKTYKAGVADSEYGESLFDRWKLKDTNDASFWLNKWNDTLDGEPYDKNDVWELNGYELPKGKTILDYAPHSFYNVKFSNIDEPLNLSASVSFTQLMRIGQSSLNGDVKAAVGGSFPSMVLTQDLLSTTRALTMQITALVVSIGLMLIIAIIVTASLLTMMTGDVYIAQYSRFMVLLRALGYSNISISMYTFGTVSVFATGAWLLGTVLAWLAIFGAVKGMWALGLAIPVGITWWPILLSFVILAIAYVGSLAVSSSKTRHTNPSTVLTATAE